MPGFAGVLSDREIHAVLDYIRSTWPPDEKAYQELMNRPAAERLLQP
jgi:mono/diheme cytochrome c family protein